MKLSTIIKGSVCVLGLVGVGNFFAAPANADQAAARGAVTVVRPSGSSISVSGELVAPSGTQFDGPLVITPEAGGGTVGGLDEDIATLTIDAGAPVVSAAVGGDSIEGAIAALITDTGVADIVELATLIRAASVNGGLE